MAEAVLGKEPAKLPDNPPPRPIRDRLHQDATNPDPSRFGSNVEMIDLTGFWLVKAAYPDSSDRFSVATR